jgi:Kef-type K+ transport system membrane component KefB
MDFVHLLLMLVVVLLAAKVSSEIAERLGQPGVVGELMIGILLGVSVLGWLPVPDFRPGHEGILVLLAQIGVVLLLFEIGLESDLDEFLKVGTSAFLVAIIGVVAPLALGFFISRLLGLSVIQSIFVGAALTATSVGITARVLSDLGRLHTGEARVILGAAVIDDILGLMVLSQVTSMVSRGSFSIWGVLQSGLVALLFLVAAVVLGNWLAPRLLDVVHTMRSRGWLTISAVIFCFTLAYCSELVGLHPIVGAFAAGLVLSQTALRAPIQDRVRPMAEFFVPLFFVIVGSAVNLRKIGGGSENWIFLGSMVLVALFSKLIAGMGVVAKRIDRLAVGFGMIPRGEVGLIFASIALIYPSLEHSTVRLYDSIVLVVLITTLITPPLLKWVLKARHVKAAKAA